MIFHVLQLKLMKVFKLPQNIKYKFDNMFKHFWILNVIDLLPNPNPSDRIFCITYER